MGSCQGGIGLCIRFTFLIAVAVQSCRSDGGGMVVYRDGHQKITKKVAWKVYRI